MSSNRWTTYLAEPARRWVLKEEQRALVASFLDLYDQRGLLQDGGAKPLYSACVCGAECWANEDSSQFPRPEIAGISTPWIGSRFLERRLVILAINFVTWGGLWANWEIKGGELAQLREGRKKINRSDFAYAIGSYAFAVLNGVPEGEALPSPQEAAEALEGCAFLQSVKCAPERERSTPNDEMTHNCPREYLLDELRLLGGSSETTSETRHAYSLKPPRSSLPASSQPN